MENVNKCAQELLESVTKNLESLEQSVEETLQEIKDVKEELKSNELEEKLEEKSVDELFGIEHVEGNTYKINVDGEDVEFERSETQFTPMSPDASIEEINEELSKYDLPLYMIKDLDKEMKITLIDYLREKEALGQEMKQMQEEYNQAAALLNQKFAELALATKDDAMELIREKIKLMEKYERFGAVDEFNKLLKEMQLSLTLENMIESLGNVKNINKISASYEQNFNKAYKKFNDRLKRNRSYRFLSTDTLLVNLSDIYEFSLEDSKLFLYTFFGYVKTETLVSKYSVFINEVIKNIDKPETLTDEQKVLFKSSIIKVLNIVNPV